jgi:XapX domain-containing protein
VKLYLLSLAVGLLVGVIYGLLQVRSPAPPVVALLGLLGILIGEQAVPLARRMLARESLTIGWVKEQCGDHVFGELPQRRAAPCDSDVAAPDSSA